jgi:hypothetical protein
MTNHYVREAIASAGRTIRGARPELQQRVFALQAADLAELVNDGKIDKLTVVDALEAAGIELGWSPEERTALIAAAFKPPPPAQNAVATSPHQAAAAAIDQRPIIQLAGGELPAIVDAAEQALLASGAALYQRGGQLVRPVVEEMPGADETTTRSWRLLPATRAHMVDSLTASANFQVYRRREKEWITVDCPDQIAEVFMFGSRACW